MLVWNSGVRSLPKICIQELLVFRWFIKVMRLDEIPQRVSIETEEEKSEIKVLGHFSVSRSEEELCQGNEAKKEQPVMQKKKPKKARSWRTSEGSVPNKGM